jgi:transposase
MAGRLRSEQVADINRNARPTSSECAGWHTAGELRVPENLTLVFLPPYSPELNPIERLWLHLRDNRLSHCVFQATEGIIDSCCEAWNWLLAQAGRIRSLCSYPWLEQVSR